MSSLLIVDRRTCSAASGLALILLVVVCDSSSGQESTEGARKAVDAAWSKNEKNIRSARFIWQEERVEAKGADREKPPIPAQDIEWRFTKKLTLAGHKMDYYATILSRDGKEPVDPQKQHEWRLFNGKKMIEYIPPLEEFAKPYPHGSLTSSKNSVVEETTARPLLWLCRMSKMRDRSLVNGQVSFGRDTNGDPIIIFRNDRRRAVDHIWVSPGRAYSIVKFFMTQNNKPIFELNISYQSRGDTKLWIPGDWRYVFLAPDGRTLVSGTGKLTEFALNPVIDPAEFVRDFPVGTYVMGDEGRYIVLKNNARRVVTEAEYDASYESLKTTETGMASKPAHMPGRSWRSYGAIAGIVGAVLILALRIVLRRRKYGGA